MKSAILLLVLAGVCLFSNSHAMKNGTEDISKKLWLAKDYLDVSEKGIDTLKGFLLIDNKKYMKFMPEALRNNTLLAFEAQKLAQEIMNDDAASSQMKQDAELCLTRALLITENIVVLSKLSLF